MTDIKKNPCDFTQDVSTYLSHKFSCQDGLTEFEEDVRPLHKIRHDYGDALLKNNGAKQKAALKKKLAKAAAKIEKIYEGKAAECLDDEFDSCGYVMAHDEYVKTFGPLDSFKPPAASSSSLELKPLQNGYLVADLENIKYGETLFDTGASVSAFGPTVYTQLNDCFIPFGTLGGTDDKVFIAEQVFMRFAEINFFPKTVIVTSFFENNLMGVDYKHGLLSFVGGDFLAGTPFEVDYDSWSMTFFPDIKNRINEEDWHRIPLNVDQELFFGYKLSMEVYIEGKPMTLLFDTGAEYTTIYDGCSQDLPKDTIIGKAPSLSVYDNGSADAAKLKVKFGGTEHVETVHLDHSKHPIGDGCGVLGANTLRHFDYIYDPNTLSLYVNERETESIYDPDFQFGGIPKLTKAGMLLLSVEEGGPLAEAGLEKGDLITEIDGQKVDNNLGKLGLWNLIANTKKNVPIEYKRGDDVHETFLRKD